MSDSPSLSSLGLPPRLGHLATQTRGLILVGGTDQSSVAAVIAALLEHVGAAGTRHIVSVESPIRWHVPHTSGVVTQRELGTDMRQTPDAIEKALRMALRADADVVALCELVEPRAIDQSLVAAEFSVLVIAALPARGVAGTIKRLARMLGRDREAAALTALSRCLRAVVCPAPVASLHADDVIAYDLLIVEQEAQALLATGDFHSLRRLMCGGLGPWDRRMDHDLLRFARDGTCSADAALDAALDPSWLASSIEELAGGTP